MRFLHSRVTVTLIDAAAHLKPVEIANVVDDFMCSSPRFANILQLSTILSSFFGEVSFVYSARFLPCFPTTSTCGSFEVCHRSRDQVCQRLLLCRNRDWRFLVLVCVCLLLLPLHVGPRRHPVVTQNVTSLLAPLGKDFANFHLAACLFVFCVSVCLSVSVCVGTSVCLCLCAIVCLSVWRAGGSVGRWRELGRRVAEASGCLRV